VGGGATLADRRPAAWDGYKLPRITGGELRPLGVGEILDVSINLYFRHLGRLLGVAAAVIVPVVVIVFLIDLAAFQEVDVFDPGAALYEIGDSVRALDQSRYQVLTVIQSVIGVIAYLLVFGAIFRAVSQAYLGDSPDARASIAYAARRMHSLFWLSFLVVLGVGVGFLLLLLPGIYLLIAWSLAVPVLMVEGLRGTKAIGRSYDLVRKNWWRTFGTLLVGFIFIGLFQFLLGLVASAADGLADDSVYLWAFVYDVISGLGTVITAPLQAAIITVIYYDLRVRKEGFDVALLSAGLGEAPVPAPAAGAPAPAASAPPTPGAASGSEPPPSTTTT
jgi:hypothetical protein